MKKLMSLVLSGAIVLIPIVNAAPALANTSVSPETSVSDTVSGTTEGTNPTSTKVVDSDGQTVTAGTLPDSPLYWFTNLIEKLQLALTFDPVKKADCIEHQALKKLADAQELVKKGKPAEAQQALENYTSKISSAQDFLNQVKDPASDKAQILLEALNKTQAANISVLSGLLDKLPPQAAQKVALNVVRSMEKAVERQVPTPTTTPDKVSNDPSHIEPDQDKDEDQNENHDQDKEQVKIKEEVKTALENLHQDLEQKGTEGNMPKLENVAKSVYSIHPRLDRSVNEDKGEVTVSRDSGEKQEGKKQQEQEKQGNNQKRN